MNACRLCQRVLLTLLAVVAGCGKAPPPATPQGHPLSDPLVVKGEPGQPGGRLTLVCPVAPRTFNPLLVQDAGADQVVHLIFGSLVELDMVTLETRPGLAQSWSVAPDGKTWTFKLRPGLRWSDGQPLTADDVVFTWNEVMYNPDMNRATYEVFRINGRSFNVSKVDDLTVRVVTPEVFAPFVEYFGGVVILPKHVIGEAVRTRNFLSVYPVTAHPQKIVGCGPFRIKRVQPDQSVLLERNPEFWMADQTGRRLPYFDEVLLLPGNGHPPATLFLEGKSDVFERGRFENYAQCKSAAGGKFRLIELGPGTEREFVWFNLNPGSNGAGKPYVNPAKLNWFRQKQFRQAVACAVDRERIVREVYDGRAQAIYGFISTENQKWNNPNIPRYTYDPARARALLAEIGLQDRNGDGVLEDGDGHAVEFTLLSNTGNAQREKSGGIITEDLRKLGLKVTFQPIDFQDLEVRISRAFDYECVLMGLAGGGVDPASQVNVLQSSERLHQWYPSQQTPATDWEARVDKLMEQQMQTLDFALRKQYFDEVQMILAEQQPMIYTVAPFNFVAVRPDLANVRPSVLTPYRVTWNAEALYFKKP